MLTQASQAQAEQVGVLLLRNLVPEDLHLESTLQRRHLQLRCLHLLATAAMRFNLDMQKDHAAVITVHASLAAARQQAE